MLVAGDADRRRRMLVRQLARAGHGVVGEAATAEAGVDAAPDIVLLDLHFPDGRWTDAAARRRA